MNRGAWQVTAHGVTQPDMNEATKRVRARARARAHTHTHTHTHAVP